MITSQKVKAVVFDYSNTLEDIETGKLYPEVHSLLKDLKNKGLKLAVVSRASNLSERLAKFEKLSLKDYFDVLDIVLAGSSKKFNHILEKLKVEAKEVLVVGDRVKSEILEGNKIGAVTVWIRRGRFMDEMPENDLEKPDYTILSLEQILQIIK